MSHSLQVLVVSTLLVGLLGGTLCHGQSRDRRSAPGLQSSSPSTEMQRPSAPSAAPPAPAPGTDLPSYAEPSAPSPQGVGEGPSSSGGTPRTQEEAPNPPGDPAQAPIGGLEWLVAAAAGYGAYRLREQSDADA